MQQIHHGQELRLPRQGGLSERENSSRKLIASDDGSAYDAYEPVQGRGASSPNRKRKWLIIGAVTLLLLAGAGVGVGVGVTQAKKNSKTGSGASNDGGQGSHPGGNNGDASTPNGDTSSSTATTGENGSEITMENGQKFTYQNDFGGNWAVDTENPYKVSGKAQSWTPSLLEEWKWGQDIVRGVNLGGWLVTEPFISPALYEKYHDATPKAVDEWTLHQAMGQNVAVEMEEHYKTFITEQDFADIAAAGLNWVRIPLGYWAIEVQGDEPFLPKVSWTYFLKAIDWARKYGIRIQLDFHAIAGSQNGWNHSGKLGQANFIYGVMGLANADRHLEYLRTLTQFISQEGIKDVVPMLGLVNELMAPDIGHDQMGAFYNRAYQMIRSMAGVGAGNGPMIAVHEGFQGLPQWNTFLPGADRLAIDQHPYQAFGGANQNPWAQQTEGVCNWGFETNNSQSNWGVVLGGEWSLAINDCGHYLIGVDVQSNYETAYGAGSCKAFTEWQKFDQATKDAMLLHTMAEMDALQNFFFWTWKIGDSPSLGYAACPHWHYQLGLKEGWIPKDPRTAGGICKRNNWCPDCPDFNGQFPASATGGVADSTVAAEAQQQFAWPPSSMGPAPSFGPAQIALMPTLTQTGTPITMPTPTHSGAGNGWAFPADTAGAFVTVAGCPYPDTYSANAVSLLPAAVCTGGAGGAAPAAASTPAAAVATPTAAAAAPEA